MISAGDHGNDRRKFEPAAAGNKALQAAAAASRHWSASTESRIVRVSRVFGGKDRHSKVRTVKGLRDRRVRLSVPTAIQLYDLQDRLGLSQPSKVVDWLLNAAQHEIDKLPPLHFPPHDDDLLLSAHHHHHLQSPASMAMVPPFSHATAATASMMVADGGKATQSAHDGAGDLKGFMSLSNSLGLVNGAGAAMPSLAAAQAGSYHHHYAAHEAWSNGGGNVVQEQLGGHRSSPFQSLLSLAPVSQFVFYTPEDGFAMKDVASDDQFPVDNLNDSQGQLSLSSERSFLHSGGQG
ncbi:transcription factor TCP13-like [Hordeum vulgare]|uniref:Uncharacterized protein n=1 Tax=Hordeum vulgare subsp. vulgare TaxID=112509 RepID=M0YKK9_HORVV|nr:transcription factor PCF6-like [Hordeum vulgare subsp. vulgare]KAE8817561.1 transcription factor TCP13-like [Hordeum vulgare]